MSEDGITGCVVALLGVLIGVYEVAEKCDGDKGCHSGKGASEVAVVANGESLEVSTGEDVIE